MTDLQEYQAHQQRMRQQFNARPALGRTLSIAQNPQACHSILGSDWWSMTGVDRLFAVAFSPVTLHPLTTLETLIAYASHPETHLPKLKAHFPFVTLSQWEDALHTVGPHHTSAIHGFGREVQLALYQWAAWNMSLGQLRSDLGSDIHAWEHAPWFVQSDALMQQIIALRKPVLLQELVRRFPAHAWDSTALALSLKKTGIPGHVRWYELMNENTFRLLLAPDPEGHPVLGKTNPALYQFPHDYLPILMDVHPALFIHGVVYHELLHDSPLAQEWFTPMLEAAFLKTFSDGSYAYALLDPQTKGADVSKLLDEAVRTFSPAYANLLAVEKTFHKEEVAYYEWIDICRKSLVGSTSNNDSIDLSDLDDFA